MTNAENITKKSGLPAHLSEAAAEVSSVCRAGWEASDGSKKIHAYRYEVEADGSVVALYANDAEGTVKTKAFDSMEEASLWTPRDEE